MATNERRNDDDRSPSITTGGHWKHVLLEQQWGNIRWMDCQVRILEIISLNITVYYFFCWQFKDPNARSSKHYWTMLKRKKIDSKHRYQSIDRSRKSIWLPWMVAANCDQNTARMMSFRHERDIDCVHAAVCCFVPIPSAEQHFLHHGEKIGTYKTDVISWSWTWFSSIVAVVFLVFKSITLWHKTNNKNNKKK